MPVDLTSGLPHARLMQHIDPAPSLESTLLGLCLACGAGKTVCPTDAAKAHAAALGGDDLAWRDWLAKVRRAAVSLATEGRLVIYRKGKPADPQDFRGVYRIGMTRSD